VPLAKLGEGFLAAQRTLGDNLGTVDVDYLHKSALDGGTSGRLRLAPRHVDQSMLRGKDHAQLDPVADLMSLDGAQLPRGAPWAPWDPIACKSHVGTSHTSWDPLRAIFGPLYKKIKAADDDRRLYGYILLSADGLLLVQPDRRSQSTRSRFASACCAAQATCSTRHAPQRRGGRDAHDPANEPRRRSSCAHTTTT
jgi:hypothetical protein